MVLPVMNIGAARWQRMGACLRHPTALRDLLRRSGFRLAWRALETWYGMDTTGSIPSSELGFAGACYGYQPIDYESLRAALRLLDDECRGGTFVDYGCGKGRAVLVAAQRPFQRVIGVELSAELCATARRNLDRARRLRRAVDAQIVHGDASEYELPDETNVIFLYNPFHGPVLDGVLDRVRESLARRPRVLNVIYALPQTAHDVLADCDWLTPAHVVSTSNDDWQRLTIYRSRLAWSPR